MEENMEPKAQHNRENLDESRYRQLGEFAKRMDAKHKGVLASILVKRPEGDELHVTLVVDDLNNVVMDEQVAGLKVSASEMAFEGDVHPEFDAILASAFWDQFKARDKTTLELLGGSYIIHDNGFLRPIQDLLVTGKIRPSKESVKVYFVKSEQSLKNADKRVAKAVLDLYWAVIDAAHAAVMMAGITPPSPKEMAETIRKELVIRNLVNKRCVEIVDRFYQAAKKIMHKEVFSVSGREFDSYLADAEFFIKEIDRFVKEHMK